MVVDPHFGERLDALAERCHVWAIDTPANRAVAERIWHRIASSERQRGVTPFRQRPGDAASETVAHVLGDVKLHHGAYSHTPPTSSLEIHGAALTNELREALAEHGR